jgi:hypothetical protein
MASTTTATVIDDASREALVFALWNHASRETDGAVYDKFEQLGDESIRLPSLQPEQRSQAAREAIEVLATLRAIEAAVDAVRAAEPGESITVALSAAAVAKGLRSCCAAIEMEPLYELPPDERDRLVGLRDAGLRLIVELRQPVEAVA